MPYDLEPTFKIDSIYRNVINTEGMPYQMAKVFTRICDGFDAKIF